MAIIGLSLGVWDLDRRRGLSLKERLDMFSERESMLYTGDVADGLSHDAFFLSFGECNEPAMRTAQSVRQSGDGIFLLLVSDRNCDLSPFFRPKIRPSGVLFRPLQNSQLRDFLYEIAEELERLSEADSGDMFMFKSEGATYRVPIKDILFFEASNKRVVLHTAGQDIAYYDSIDNLSTMLPQCFVRCHRSFIVNIRKIESMHGANMELLLAGSYRVPFSRSRRDQVIQALTAAAACGPQVASG